MGKGETLSVAFLKHAKSINLITEEVMEKTVLEGWWAKVLV